MTEQLYPASGADRPRFRRSFSNGGDGDLWARGWQKSLQALFPLLVWPGLMPHYIMVGHPAKIATKPLDDLVWDEIATA